MRSSRPTMLLALATLAGCQAMLESEMRSRSSTYLDCPTEGIHITHPVVGVSGVSPSTWNAEGCGRRFVCSHWRPADELDIERVDCREDTTSPDEERRQFALDSLATKTRCPADRIAVESARPGGLPSERVFLMEACGTRFECTTDGSTTDCTPVDRR